MNALWFGKANRLETGRLFDHAAPSLSINLLYVYRLKKDQNSQPTIDVVKRIQSEPSNEAAKHGITWWWCDALFMAPPTLARLAKTTGDESYLALNDKLFQQTYDLLYDKEEHLFARDSGYLINEKGEGKREANGKKSFGVAVTAGFRRLGEIIG